MCVKLKHLLDMVVVLWFAPIELRTDQDGLVLQQALQREYHRDTGEGRGGMAGDDLVELKFRLYDGTDIGPNKYAPASTIATLKESILSQWPQGEYLCPSYVIVLLSV
jgi:hypothetical protein